MRALCLLLVLPFFALGPPVWGAGQATLTWPAVPYVDYYVVELYQSPKLQKRIKKMEADSNQATLRGLSPGSYTLRIASVDKWGQQGPWSQTATVILTAPPAAMEAMEATEKPDEDVARQGPAEQEPEKKEEKSPAEAPAPQKAPSAARSLAWSLGAGGTFHSYQENDLAFDQYALTAKAAVTLPFGQQWDFGANTFVTALPLSVSQSDVSFRVWGLNARAGYRLPLGPGEWTLKLVGGFYYSTTFASVSDATASDLSFGYKNTSGPQLFPVLVRSLPRGASLSLYAKFSPLLDDLELSSFSNREVAVGSQYQFATSGPFSSWALALHWAQLDLDADTQNISSNSLTLELSRLFD